MGQKTGSATGFFRQLMGKKAGLLPGFFADVDTMQVKQP
jgi:hypothetical protein